MLSDAQTTPAPSLIETILDGFDQVTEEKLIPLLQRVQNLHGYLPRDLLLELSARTGIPASRMYGVATFYEQFHLKPRGRHTIRCCRGTACHVKAGAEIIEVLQRTLGVSDGGTTPDFRFTLETVACLGTCFLVPVTLIDNDYYGNLTPKKAETVLKRYE